jgi:hypothetical protein
MKKGNSLVSAVSCKENSVPELSMSMDRSRDIKSGLFPNSTMGKSS